MTIESNDTVTYLRDGQVITESRVTNYGSSMVAVKEQPVPAFTIGGTQRLTVELPYEDSAEAAVRKQGEFLQARLRELQDKDGNLKPEHYDRAVKLSAALEQLAQSREADAQLAKMRAQREARGQAAPGGMLYEGDERGGTVTFHHAAPSAQEEFNALVSRIDATRRRG